MPKFWNRSKWIGLLIISVWATASLAQGIEYQIGGFIQNQSAARFKNGATGENWTFPLVRNTLQLEGFLQLNPNFRLVGIYRGAYEASFALDGRLNQFPKKELDFENDLREIYADIITNNWSLRMGRQQVVWGESDGLRLADIINPLDLRWHYFLESFEDIRRPIWLMLGTYALPAFHDLSLELVYIPWEFLPAQIAPFGANWAFLTPPNSGPVEITDNIPENSVENSEVGTRLKGTFSGWEVSVLGFYTRSDAPIAVFRGFNLNTFAVQLSLEYRLTNVLGFTLNKFLGWAKTVFRGEFTYTANQPYNTYFFNDPGDPDDDILADVKKPTINYVIGLDRPTLLPINPHRSVFLSAQFFQTIILDYDDNLIVTGYPSTQQKEIVNLISFYSNTGYFHDKLQPEFLGIYDFRGQGWLQPKLSYSYNDYWRITLGANLLFGNNAFEGPFGFFQENDEMFLQIRFAL